MNSVHLQCVGTRASELFFLKNGTPAYGYGQGFTEREFTMASAKGLKEKKCSCPPRVRPASSSPYLPTHPPCVQKVTLYPEGSSL